MNEFLPWKLSAPRVSPTGGIPCSRRPSPSPAEGSAAVSSRGPPKTRRRWPSPPHRGPWLRAERRVEATLGRAALLSLPRAGDSAACRVIAAAAPHGGRDESSRAFHPSGLRRKKQAQRGETSPKPESRERPGRGRAGRPQELRARLPPARRPPTVPSALTASDGAVLSFKGPGTDGPGGVLHIRFQTLAIKWILQ